ncbi:hypothetical protein T484DRAFT_1978304 [Baffinella frigidus]|nr:hypothetical protein T484DRAFT_1978304 [Cryptophyta sp. CCMP2293]
MSEPGHNAMASRIPEPAAPYRGTSLIRNRPPLGPPGTSITRKRLPVGPYSRAMPRALWSS